MVANYLELKFPKCAFLLTEITYLGYRINEHGIRPGAGNISAILEYLIPRTYREVQSFSGLTSYFRKFIKNFAILAKPLYDLLKTKTEFVWNNEALTAFGRLKEQLISEPILAIYSASAATELHCDASAHGYGSVLLQKQTDGKFHLISYFTHQGINKTYEYLGRVY